MIKKIFGGVGIALTVAHLVYYLYAQYDALYFFMGFGLLYILFVLPLNLITK